jgi:hypothetical protein
MSQYKLPSEFSWSENSLLGAQIPGHSLKARFNTLLLPAHVASACLFISNSWKGALHQSLLPHLTQEVWTPEAQRQGFGGFHLGV